MNKFTNTLKIFPTDLKIILTYLFITLIFLIIPPLNETFIRTILELPMVLFIPGYIIVAALFIKKNDLDGIERVGLSIGFSIAVVLLMGLMLNFLQFGIQFWSIVISLILFTFLLIVFTYKKRLDIPADMQFTIQNKNAYFEIKNELFNSKSKIDKILTIILISTIILSLITLVYVITFPRDGEKFTEFYILGPDGMATDFPSVVRTGEPINLIVGVVNYEHSDIDYTIHVRIGGITHFEEKIQLFHNQKWENPVSFKINTTGNDLKVEFLLFKENNNLTPYRSLHLWIDSIY